MKKGKKEGKGEWVGRGRKGEEVQDRRGGAGRGGGGGGGQEAQEFHTSDLAGVLPLRKRDLNGDIKLELSLLQVLLFAF